MSTIVNQAILRSFRSLSYSHHPDYKLDAPSWSERDSRWTTNDNQLPVRIPS